MAQIRLPPHSLQELLEVLQYAAGPFTAAEIVLAALLLLLALVAPRAGAAAFDRLEGALPAWTSRPLPQILLVGAFAIAARGALLPWLGEPAPYVFDEQSILLQAQTLAHGRLANPTHPFWRHFEAYYVNQVPAYASMYFPGRGAPPALGLLLANDAWLGVWISVVALCMAATWMLQAWVPAPYALLGGLLVAIRVGVFSDWINSYLGGAFTGLGAMLVVGALPRLLRAPSWPLGAVMGLGMVVLMTTRPYEGLLLCVPVALALLVRLRRAAPRVRWQLAAALLPAALLVGCGGALLVAHDEATTGEPLKSAWTLHREQYGGAPGFLVSRPLQSAQGGPAQFRRYYAQEEAIHRHRDSPGQVARGMLAKLFHSWNFHVGPLFTIALLAGMLQARRNRFVLGAVAVFYCGFALETFNHAQYSAPVYPLLLILVMSGLARLRASGPRGLFLARTAPVAALLLLALPTVAAVRGADLPTNSHASCCVVSYWELQRGIVRRLQATPGRDLVLVEGGPQSPVSVDVVWNDADIDAARIVWARSLGPQQDAALRRYFADRRAWIFRWDPAAPGGYRLAPAAPAEVSP